MTADPILMNAENGHCTDYLQQAPGHECAQPGHVGALEPPVDAD